jgi:hypothetical protein
LTLDGDLRLDLHPLNSSGSAIYISSVDGEVTNSKNTTTSVAIVWHRNPRRTRLAGPVLYVLA